MPYSDLTRCNPPMHSDPHPGAQQGPIHTRSNLKSSSTQEPSLVHQFPLVKPPLNSFHPPPAGPQARQTTNSSGDHSSTELLIYGLAFSTPSDPSLPPSNRILKSAKMTSMAAESVATILCTSKQTRFQIDSANYREVKSLQYSTLIQVPKLTRHTSCSSTLKALASLLLLVRSRMLARSRARVKPRALRSSPMPS